MDYHGLFMDFLWTLFQPFANLIREKHAIEKTIAIIGEKLEKTLCMFLCIHRALSDMHVQGRGVPLLWVSPKVLWTNNYVPLVLLSDGTDPTAQPQHHQDSAPAEGRLQGIPASAGVVTGIVRVIHNPNTATLLPGEILVAPTTDPGWTPLFLHASGLVMDVGGAMAHGAIIAREYGIPAVVGVAGATERIPTGSRITVNGTTGVITFEQVE